MSNNAARSAEATAPSSMGHLIRPALAITILTAGGQALLLLSQMVIAAFFGAGAAMDAYVAANTLPQYLVTVLIGSLSVVFVPVFLHYDASGRHEDAWRVAGGMFSLCAIALLGIALAGMLLARPLLQVTTPGLSEASLALATRVALVMWPAIVATGLVGLLTGIHHARGRFAWPAAVPAIATLVSLGIVIALARPFGIIIVAIAGTTSLALQVVLLTPIVRKEARFYLNVDWRSEGVRRVLVLMWPLLLSSLMTRWTPVVDRYLASNLPQGTLSHLGYAFRLVSVLTIVVSAGISAVVFPRMATDTAASDLSAFGQTLSLALRLMWLAVAPIVTIGIALGLPFIVVLLRRGAFGYGDALAVAGLWQTYLLALVGACLGSVTGRAFYALKDTRTVAVIGVVEAVGYLLYAPYLAHTFGAIGVATSYVVYFTISLLWHFPVLRYKVGSRGGRRLVLSFMKTAGAAILAGCAAWGGVAIAPTAWGQLLLGGFAGLLVYLAALAWWGGAEVEQVKSASILALRRLTPQLQGLLW